MGSRDKRKGGLTLDLAAKLAAAGLVDKKAAEEARAQKAAAEKKAAEQKAAASARRSVASAKRSAAPAPASAPKTAPAQSPGTAAGLAARSRDEQYAAIRTWIERNRLDRGSTPGSDAESHHFTTAHGKLARLMLEPDVRRQVVDGRAGIVAFMSNHGLAHAAVPRATAEEIHQLFPLWLRVLKNHDGAGKYEEKP